MKIRLIIWLTISNLFFSSNLSFSQSKFLINGEPFELPGKWETKGLIKESGQYHLYNKKRKLNLLISVRKAQNFEFHNDSLSPRQLLEKWYKWEFDHWSGQDVEITRINADETKNYILWRLNLKKLEGYNKAIVSTILYFVKNEKLIGINLNDGSDKNHMSENEMIKFLEDLYKN